MVFNSTVVVAVAHLSADAWQQTSCCIPTSERVSSHQLLDLVCCFPLQQLGRFALCLWNYFCLSPPSDSSFYSYYDDTSDDDDDYYDHHHGRDSGSASSSSVADLLDDDYYYHSHSDWWWVCELFLIFFDGFVFDCNEIDGLLLPFLFFGWVNLVFVYMPFIAGLMVNFPVVVYLLK